MIAGLHLCAVMTAEMTAVKTAGAVAEVGVAHPVLNPEGMTAAHLCVAMTAVDPVTDPVTDLVMDPVTDPVTDLVMDPVMDPLVSRDQPEIRMMAGQASRPSVNFSL